MRRSAEAPDAAKVRVIDADTGAEIKNVTWADDETGEYEQAETDSAGQILTEIGADGCRQIRLVVRKGRIRFEDRE